jgi:RNA polymerase sigma-70 factor (ECF subfamily)
VAIRADDVDLDRDAALVERFQAGDADAFADLYSRYHARLRRYCLRRLHDPDDAEDVTQEALVRAYRALPRLAGERRFYPWLRVIAANLCSDMYRRPAVAPLAEPPAGDTVVEAVFDELDRAQVRAVLEDLAPRHRAALTLWAEGVPSKGIASELGCSTGAADVTVHRARQSFRRRFAALVDEKNFGAAGLGAAWRWLGRTRMRFTARVAQHAELLTPVAAKAVAGAIALGVVGGAAATGGQSQRTDPVPVSVVRVAPAASSSAPASRTGAPPVESAGHVPAHAPAAPAPSRTSPPPPLGGRVPGLMTADEGQRESADAPFKVNVAGAFVNVDPRPVTNSAQRIASLGRSK